jgi:hypothetical protein
MGEQHLRCSQAMLGKAALVDLREPHLADCGSGLQFMHFPRALPPA